MRFRDTVRMVAGSIGIYVVVAACGSHGGNTVTSGDGGRDAKSPVRDALTDPVSEASADENQSGTRLKAERYVGSDMSSQFIGFYDSMLDINCSFGEASDGVVYCLPSGGAAAGVVAGQFSDSTCMQPVAAIAQGCKQAPKYAVESVGNGGCPSPGETEVYSIGAEVTGSVYAMGTKCVALTAKETANYHYYSLGSPVTASSTFVSATVQKD